MYNKYIELSFELKLYKPEFANIKINFLWILHLYDSFYDQLKVQLLIKLVRISNLCFFFQNNSRVISMRLFSEFIIEMLLCK